MIIETRAVPPFQKNGYVVACETTREAVVIDPGDEVDMLLDVVGRQSLNVQSILLTHAHVDHVTGVARAKQALQVPVYLHRDDQFLYDAAPQQAAFFGLHCDALPAIDRLLRSVGDAVVRRIRSRDPSHARTLSRRCLSGDWQQGGDERRSVRRRYAVRRLDWQDRSPWWRSPDPDSIDHAGAVCLRRCGAGVLGAWPADDHRPGAPDESVPEARLSRRGPDLPASRTLRDTINSSRPTDSLSPSRSSAVFTRLPLTNVPFVLPRSFT